MKTTKAAVFVLISLLTAIPTLGQRSSAQRSPATGSLSSYNRARQVLDAGVEALGGIEAIRASQDVKVVVKGHSYARNQSLAVNAPYDKMTRDETLYIDLRNRRYLIETRDPLPGGFVFGGTQVITGNQGFFINPRDKTVTPLNLTNFNNIGIIRRLPHLLLLFAYENAPSTLRWIGREMYDGRPHNVITVASSNGLQWTAFFDAKTNLLTKYEQLVSDNVAGDAIQETIFPAYRTAGKVKVPARRVSRRGGELTEEVEYQQVTFDLKLDESAFAKPKGFDELPTPTPAPTRETKLDDGVYLFESGSNSLVVEFKDHIMVVEPYAGGRGARATIAKIKEMFPSKPIKYVVITHHHDDHSGGLRAYIAEGATVVTTTANRKYFERMAAATFTINPDEQSKKKMKPTFQFLENKRSTFTDGQQTVELIDVGPGPHANEMLVAYLPKVRIIFQGDLVNVPNNGKFQPTTVNDSTVHFHDVTLKNLGLPVEKVAGVHGATVSLSDLKDAIEDYKKRR